MKRFTLLTLVALLAAGCSDITSTEDTIAPEAPADSEPIAAFSLGTPDGYDPPAPLEADGARAEARAMLAIRAAVMNAPTLDAADAAVQAEMDAHPEAPRHAVEQAAAYWMLTRRLEDRSLEPGDTPELSGRYLSLQDVEDAWTDEQKRDLARTTLESAEALDCDGCSDDPEDPRRLSYEQNKSAMIFLRGRAS